jgi:UDP-N-acetylmuramoyl-tripeptide--D-alanyl-D-alanine ligase
VRVTTSELAAAVGGRLVGPDALVDGAAIDSRELRPGALFVAVQGERDGHDFLDDAFERGAAAGLVSGVPAPAVGVVRTYVVVGDTVAALAALGALARERLPVRRLPRLDGEGEAPAPVVGITGSVGKTTTKDLLTSVLATRLPTAASPRSFNNELGVPLTLLDAPDDTGALVIEMGARGHGHIAELCAIARPTVGVVTTVESVHTEHFKDVAGVAVAKGELVEAVPVDGLVVLNGDNLHVASMSERAAAPVVLVSRRAPSGTDAASVWADAVRLDDELRPRFTLRSPAGSAEVVLPVRGEHNVMNALLAAATGLGVGIPLDAVVEGLRTAGSSPWRMELVTAPLGLRVLNDAYNAGPASMAAALRALACLPADRRLAVLGVMAELGEGGDDDHRSIAELALELGIEVVAVDAPAYGPDVTHVDGLAGAEAELARRGPFGPADAVLVKASRVAGLERLAARLVTPD